MIRIRLTAVVLFLAASTLGAEENSRASGFSLVGPPKAPFAWVDGKNGLVARPKKPLHWTAARALDSSEGERGKAESNASVVCGILVRKADPRADSQIARTADPKLDPKIERKADCAK